MSLCDVLNQQVSIYDIQVVDIVSYATTQHQSRILHTYSVNITYDIHVTAKSFYVTTVNDLFNTVTIMISDSITNNNMRMALQANSQLLNVTEFNNCTLGNLIVLYSGIDPTVYPTSVPQSRNNNILANLITTNVINILIISIVIITMCIISVILCYCNYYKTILRKNKKIYVDYLSPIDDVNTASDGVMYMNTSSTKNGNIGNAQFSIVQYNKYHKENSLMKKSTRISPYQ
jgi:hypothetical protein